MSEQKLMDRFVSRGSRATANRLKEIRKTSLHDALVKTLIPTIHSQEFEEISSVLNEINSKIGEIHYLEESTVSLHRDPRSRAMYQLNKGFKTSDMEFNLKETIPWESMDEVSRNTQYKLQSWQMIDAQLVAVTKGHEDPHLQISQNLALDWIDTFIFKQKKKGFIWYDMAVGQRATKIAYLTRKAIENGASAEILMPLLIAADVHMIELMQENRIAMHSNHGLFQMAGLLALSASLPFLRHAEKGLEVAGENISIMLDNHFASDGLHLEHSPEYHIFMTNFVSQICEVGWLNNHGKFKTLAEKAIAATSWLIQPDGNILPHGDSKNIPASQRLRYPVPTITESGVMKFVQGGLGISYHLDENDQPMEMLSLTAQFHSRQHKHADDLSFHYCAKGRQLLVDSGTYTYQYDSLERMYVESTRAHNAIEIDEKNTSRFAKDSFGSALVDTLQVGPLTILSAKIQHQALNPANHPYNTYKPWHRSKVDIQHQRVLFQYANRFLIIVDMMSSKDVHSYTQWFHFAPDLIVNKSDAGNYICSDQDGMELLTLQSITVIDEEEFIRGQKTPHLQGWTGMSGTTLEPSHAIGYKQMGRECTMCTLVSLVPGSIIDSKLDFEESKISLSFNDQLGPVNIKFKKNSEISNLNFTIGDDYYSIEK